MIIDIINKKRLGEELSFHELDTFFNGYLEGKVKDYQMSSLLMAICIQGMSEEETFALTKVFIDSGDTLDLSFLHAITVDKHSTGGIGDKTTLIIAPIVASLGVPVLKMSGRGLGYTGGTIDKLESIPGFRIDLSEEEVMHQVQDIGIVITGQTASLAPMDKKIYALRDVTGTVSSIPLIASSIMSKKIAGGADKILIDIKVGNGALLQTKEDAEKLSDLVIKIGKVYQKEVHTIISDMDTPLGYCIGNSLEVMEAMDVLKGNIDTPFANLCIELASNLVSMGKNIPMKEAEQEVIKVLKNNQAYNKFLEFVKYQHGDINSLEISPEKLEVRSTKNGILKGIDAKLVGEVSMKLGAGRLTKDDPIDHKVGIVLNKQINDKIVENDLLCTLYVNKVKDEFNIRDAFIIE